MNVEVACPSEVISGNPFTVLRDPQANITEAVLPRTIALPNVPPRKSAPAARNPPIRTSIAPPAKFSVNFRPSNMISRTTALMGIVAAINAAETGSVMSWTTSRSIVPVPKPNAPIARARDQGALMTRMGPSMINHNGNINAQARTIRAVMSEIGPQVFNNTSAAGKPVANSAIAVMQMTLLCSALSVPTGVLLVVILLTGSIPYLRYMLSVRLFAMQCLAGNRRRCRFCSHGFWLEDVVFRNAAKPRD